MLLIFPRLEAGNNFSKNEIRPPKVNNNLDLLPLLICVDSVQNMLLPPLKTQLTFKLSSLWEKVV